MERDKFWFYRKWMNKVRGLPDDVRLEFYESVIRYAFGDEIEGLKPMVGILFSFIKEDLDRDIASYKAIVERNRKNGHPERNRETDDLRLDKRTCPEESIIQIGNMDNQIPAELFFKIALE